MLREHLTMLNQALRSCESTMQRCHMKCSSAILALKISMVTGYVLHAGGIKMGMEEV